MVCACQQAIQPGRHGLQVFESLLQIVHPAESSPQQHTRILILQARLSCPADSSTGRALEAAAEMLIASMPQSQPSQAAAYAEAASAHAQAALCTAGAPFCLQTARNGDATRPAADGVMQHSMQAILLWEEALQQSHQPQQEQWAEWGHDLPWARHVACELGFLLALQMPDGHAQLADTGQRISSIVQALSSGSELDPWWQTLHFGTAAILYPDASDVVCMTAGEWRSHAQACAKAARKGTAASLQRIWCHCQAAVLAICQGEGRCCT